MAKIEHALIVCVQIIAVQIISDKVALCTSYIINEYGLTIQQYSCPNKFHCMSVEEMHEYKYKN